MARAIDADEFERFLMNLPDEVLCEDCCYVVVNEMRKQPTIEAEPVKQEWISVKDRLPKAEYGESDSVLAISELGTQEVLYFDGGCWCYPTGEVRDSDFLITHWMPLPEPPKEEE